MFNFFFLNIVFSIFLARYNLFLLFSFLLGVADVSTGRGTQKI